MLEAKNYIVAYRKGEPVVKGVSLTLNPGEPAILLGPNGSGKSTLIKALSGVIKPRQGAMAIDGVDIIDNKTRSQAIAYVPQVAYLPPLSVFEVVLLGRLPEFGLRATKEDYEATSKILEELGLSEFADRNAQELSGGEAQKVMLARALVGNPKAVFFDEPTSNLDIANQLLIQDAIKQISKRGVMTLIAMHDINLALGLGKQFYCLKDGVVIKQGDESIIDSKLLFDLYGVDADISDHDGHKHIHFEGVHKHEE